MENGKVKTWRFIFGVLMLLVVVWRIYDAERAMRTVNSIIAEIRRTSPQRVNPSNDGFLVWVNGKITTGEELTDGYVGTIPSAYFKRKVETYRWCRTTKGKYVKQWVEELATIVKASGCDGDAEHRNIPSRYGSTQVYMARNFSVGAYNFNARDITTLNLTAMTNLPQYGGLRNHSGVYYTGNPAAPVIGDSRISYYFLPVGSEISVIGLQKGNFIVPYNGMMYAANGSVSDKDLVFADFNRVKGDKMKLPRFFNFVLMFVSLWVIAGSLPWMMQKSSVYFYAVVTFFSFAIAWFVSLLSEML